MEANIRMKRQIYAYVNRIPQGKMKHNACLWQGSAREEESVADLELAPPVSMIALHLTVWAGLHECLGEGCTELGR